MVSKIALNMIDSTKTLFGSDLPSLELEVVYHENYHVQIKVSYSIQVLKDKSETMHGKYRISYDRGLLFSLTCTMGSCFT